MDFNSASPIIFHDDSRRERMGLQFVGTWFRDVQIRPRAPGHGSTFQQQQLGGGDSGSSGGSGIDSDDHHHDHHDHRHLEQQQQQQWQWQQQLDSHVLHMLFQE